METDKITEIGIDTTERLYIKPENVKFTLIYRTATEVHWDNEGLFLYSPKPKDWSYLQWFKHIINVAEDCNCKLIITENTKWKNISDELKNEISK
jgi:hypothetical protein